MTRAALIALLFCLLSGCDAELTRWVAEAPNHDITIDITQEPTRRELAEMGADSFLRVPVGPPRASLGLWIVEPKHGEPRGTILVLHGVNDGPNWMKGKAAALAEHGYRAVLVGARGYAASTGRYRGYGVFERDDLKHVTDVLDGEGLLAGDLGVWGISYGGATAIEYAAIDPRVRAVVAVSAFSSMRTVVPHCIRVLIPVVGWFKSDEECQRIVDDAGRMSGFNPDDADAAAAIARTTAPVLLAHGEWDMIVPFENARTLHAAAPDHSELLPLPITGHTGAWMDLGGRVERASNEWFDRYLRAPPPGSDHRAPPPDQEPDHAPPTSELVIP